MKSAAFVVLLLLLPWASILADSIGPIDLTPAAGWHGAPVKEASLPTQEYTPADDRNAKILVTIVPSAVFNVTDAESLRSFHRAVCTPFRGDSTTDYSPRRVPGEGVTGWYATFEDPSLVGKPTKRGSYKVATTVVVWTPPEHVVHATIFTDAVDSPDIAAGLKMLATAHTGSRKVVANEVRRHGLSVGVRVPARFSPGEKMNTNPGYFMFQDEQHGYALSGWLDENTQFKGMKAFWADEKEGIAKSGLTAQNETFKTVGDWQAVLYTVDIGGGAIQRHLRACRVVGDTWIDVHLSTTEPAKDSADLEALLGEMQILRDSRS